ncbi:MAG: hypothetical protein KC413_03925, partial [Anaerolineales bacterium]|nr:hypothetical protein [Anaerolineales bacterium]
MALQKRIKGRDKTTPTKYSIHLSVMADWLKVVGKTGYLVYSSHVMITALGIEIGTRKLADHLGMSQPAFMINTELLDMLGLVKLHRGGFTRPNIVDILDPPLITPGTLADIRAAALEDEVIGRKSATFFREALFKRLDNWSSLSDHIDFELITVAMPTSNGNGKSTAGNIVNNGDTVPSDLLTRLEKIRFDNAAAWLADQDAALVAAWLNELEQNNDLKKRVKLPAGFLRTKVEEGEYPVNPSAPAGMKKCPKCGNLTSE